MIFRNVLIFITFLVLIHTGVSAAIISVSPGTLSGPGQSGSVELSLDSAENGLSGYILSVYPEDPTIATISGATFPAWASLSDVAPGSGGAFTIKALDLNEEINSGATGIPLATLNLNGITSGNTRIMVEAKQMDDDLGGAIQVQAKAGSITVGGSSGGQEVSLTLKPGWNLIGIPMTLQSGSDTAEIFKDVQSEGHSIFTYNSIDGWKTTGRTEVLTAMNAYWIYTSKEITIPLKVSGPPTMARSLNAGWSIMGIPGSSSVAAATALSSLTDWTYVIGFDASVQQYQQPIIRGGSGQNSDQTLLNPGFGYWIYLPAPGSLSP